MKNHLTILSELFGAPVPSISLTETATLEFCYDHITEDFPETAQNALQALQYTDFQILGIQDTE